MTDFSTSFAQWLAHTVGNVNAALSACLPNEGQVPCHLHEAMHYAVLGPGKRIRAALVYATGLAACGLSHQQGKAQQQALAHAASAVELIHAYSLIHDDLPCMDDDTLRRGRPTCHVKYGESLALLAADALQPLAFKQLASMPISAHLVVESIQILAHASGSLGMVGGQAIDVGHVDHVLSLENLKQMHRMKTGAMIEASVSLGGLASQATTEESVALAGFGQAIGLAFQIVDDILDVTAESEELGKTAGKDADHNKPTYVSLMGLDASQHLAKTLYQQAIHSLLPLGESAQRLRELAHFIVYRRY